MVIILLADGFEELEALSPLDILMRAGLEVKTVGITGMEPVGTHGVRVRCDLSPDEVDLERVDLAIFPGGMPGSVNLHSSPFTDTVISSVLERGGRLAAICAAPLVLGRRGLLEGRRATCFPGFEHELKGAITSGDAVVTDGNITTARSFDCAFDFGRELASLMTRGEGLPELRAACCTGKKDFKDYKLPPTSLLRDALKDDSDVSDEVRDNADVIIDTLTRFGADGSIVNCDVGPRILRYHIAPARNVKANAVVRLFDDIALSLAAEGIRMEAPIPGTGVIGLEVPRRKPAVLTLKELLDTEELENVASKTAVCIGRDVAGKPVYGDVAKFPHALIAGATGMGKSVFMGSLLTSILMRATPDEVRFILIDPKKVEFSNYRDIPHLLFPIVTDVREAAAALRWAVDEMERRYGVLENTNSRNIDAYNTRCNSDKIGEPMPKIVIAIDELSDLMMTLRNPIEDLIMRIAQKARAAGIHLLIGTQRPDVKVVTGTVKANIPTRVCFKTASNVDSRTVIESSGAEKLLGKGDMLYRPIDRMQPVRVQGTFVSDDEVMKVCDYLRREYGAATDTEAYGAVKKLTEEYLSTASSPVKDDGDEYEPLTDKTFLEAVEISINSGKVSTSLLQRRLAIGYGRAAKYLDVMEEMGIVSESSGTKPREVLITLEEWYDKLAKAD